jgi:hypothetical protein
MIEKLLTLRLEFFREDFSRNKSTAQRKLLWGKLACKLNLELALALPTSSIQNKYAKLQTEYSQCKAEFEKTGNEGNVMDELPAYWEILLAKFGGKSGLGNSFGDSDVSSVDDGGETDYDEEPESEVEDENGSGERKRKREIQGEIDSQRSKRKPASRESSIADGLLAIASAMAASAAPPSAPPAPVSAIEGTLSSIANSLQEQSACLRFLMENLRK